LTRSDFGDVDPFGDFELLRMAAIGFVRFRLGGRA
jgi:hypothetical protein